MSPALVQRLIRRLADNAEADSLKDDWRMGVVLSQTINAMIRLSGARRVGRTFEPRDFFGGLPKMSDLPGAQPREMSPEEQAHFWRRWRGFYQRQGADLELAGAN